MSSWYTLGLHLNPRYECHVYTQDHLLLFIDEIKSFILVDNCACKILSLVNCERSAVDITHELQELFDIEYVYSIIANLVDNNILESHYRKKSKSYLSGNIYVA